MSNKFKVYTFDTLDKRLLKERKKALTKFVKGSLNSEWFVGVSDGELVTNGVTQLELIALLELTKQYVIDTYNEDE